MERAVFYPEQTKVWLPGSNWVVLPRKGLVYQVYPEACVFLRGCGEDLDKFGVFPQVKGNPNATHGNFAHRVPGGFINTCAGACKPRLQELSFVLVEYVNWSGEQILTRHPEPERSVFPSTDALNQAAIFDANPLVNIILHFHLRGGIRGDAQMRLPRQTTRLEDCSALVEFVTQSPTGRCEINLVGHEGGEEIDAAIVTGSERMETMKRAAMRIQEVFS